MRQALVILMCCVTSSAMSQVGDPAPDFTATDVHGQSHTLYDYLEEGRVVVLDFFYTTCGPCIYYSPQVNLAYEKYGCNLATTVFMGIDYDDTDAEVLAYEEEQETEYPSISGLDGGGNAIVQAYGVNSFPRFYVIDSTKKIVDVIDPPTLQVFDARFDTLGIEEAECIPVGIDDQRASSDIRATWDGVNQKVVVHLPNAEPSAHVFVFDLQGKHIQQRLIKNNEAIDFSAYQSGLYLLRVEHASGIWTGKIVVP